MSEVLPIQVPEELAEFCRRNCVARLSVFGSALRPADFGAESDLDVLVEFVAGSRVSLFDIGGMAVELSEMFGRRVDLRTPQDLSKYFRSRVMAEAKLLYAA